MNVTSYTRADQLIPVSKARATLSSLIEDVSQKDFFILVKKYQPKAALVDLSFFNKLVEVYQEWKRKQDLTSWEKIRQSIPTYKSSEVEKDIQDAIRAVRRSK